MGSEETRPDAWNKEHDSLCHFIRSQSYIPKELADEEKELHNQIVSHIAECYKCNEAYKEEVEFSFHCNQNFIAYGISCDYILKYIKEAGGKSSLTSLTTAFSCLLDRVHEEILRNREPFPHIPRFKKDVEVYLQELVKLGHLKESICEEEFITDVAYNACFGKEYMITEKGKKYKLSKQYRNIADVLYRENLEETLVNPKIDSAAFRALEKFKNNINNRNKE